MEWNPATWVEDARHFAFEVRNEFRKVTWPSQKEAVAGTVGVVVIVAVITTALSLVDLGLGQVMKSVLP